MLPISFICFSLSSICVKIDFTVLPLLERSLMLSLSFKILGGPSFSCPSRLTPGAYENVAVLGLVGLLFGFSKEPTDESSIILFISKWDLLFASKNFLKLARNNQNMYKLKAVRNEVVTDVAPFLGLIFNQSLLYNL